jgi:hypothetical protein
MRALLSLTRPVTPAKAGVHHPLLKFGSRVMDSRLLGNDEALELKDMLV